MIERRDVEQVRAVLVRNRDAILSRHKATGVGIGKAEAGAEEYVIVVYVEKEAEKPEEALAVEGVPLEFVVSGAFKLQ